MQTQSELNILEKNSVFSLLLKYSIPAVIGTTASSLYNIIDRIIISHGVGPLAISGLALTLPLMSLSVAFGTLVGVGSSAIISIRLGEKKKEEALNILGNALILNIIIGLLYTVFGLLFLDEILYLFGATENTISYARDFMQIILAANLITQVFFGLNDILRSSGYPQKAMFIMLMTVAINVILAPVFIFVFHWGIRGAALATVVAQLIGMIFVLIHFINPTHSVFFSKKCFKLNVHIIKDIFSIGMAPFILHISASLVAMFMNMQLGTYGGDMAIGAFGIINSVNMLFAMIVVGLNQGMQPIVGYNYGAKNYSSVIKTCKYGALVATVITTIGFLCTRYFPHLIAMAFTKDADLLSMSVIGLRITFVTYMIVGFQMVSSNFFQSIGKAKISIFLSLSRQVLFLIPALYFLPPFFQLKGVWYASPTSDIISFILTFIVVFYQYKKLKEASFT